MDPITQGLIGGTAAAAVVQPRIGRWAALIGALAGMAPDLDILIRSADNPLLFFLYHRHFTHSLLFIPLGALVVALGLRLFIRTRHVPWWGLYAAAVLGFATHGLLDSLTSYGTLLFWPFTNARIALDWMPIVDLFFSTILFCGLGLACYLNKVRYARVTLVLAVLYICFGAWQHQRAVDVLKTQSGTEITRYQVMPDIGQLTVWRAVYQDKAQIYRANIAVPLWQATQFKFLLRLPNVSVSDLPEAVQTVSTLVSDFNLFKWFSRGFVAQLPQQKNTIVDMRYALMTARGSFALWGIALLPERKHAVVRRQIPFKKQENHER